MHSLSAFARYLGLSASLVIAAWIVGWAMTAQAASPYFVATTGSDTNDCLSLPTACRTIGAALNKAVADDLIIIADGTYTEHLTLDKNITLVGFGQDVTTISGGAVGRVLTVTAGVTAEVSNVRLANGVGDYAGGAYISGTLHLSRVALAGHYQNAIFNDGTLRGTALTVEQSNYVGLFNRGTAILTTSALAHNRIGIINYGEFELANSHVISNTPGGLPGGGIANYGTMKVDGSTIRGNTVLAESGGGIYNAGRLWINNTLIISNTAWSPPQPLGNQNPEAVPHSWGGGIYNYFGTLTLTNSTLTGSSASSGGDQIADGGSTVMVNVTMSGDDGHHGVETGGLMTLTNVTIANMPSGIAVWGSTVAYDTIVSTSCYFGTMTSLGHNLDSGNTCGFSATGDLTNTNPLLGPLQDNGGPTPTYALLPGSPAINAGENAACPATDQRGVPRPQAGRCDIGAYEYVMPVETYLPFVAR